MVRSCKPAAALILAGITVAGCSAPAAPDIRWTDLLKVSRTYKATDLVMRAAPESLGALGKGWSIDADTTLDTGFWAVGVESSVHLFAVQEGAHVLAFEAMPPDGSDYQLVSLQLNGLRVSEPIALEGGWRRYSVPIPPEALRIGYNRLRLRFRDTFRPTDRNPDSTDDRNLAARFQYLQLVAPEGNRAVPPEVDPVTVIGLSAVPTEAPQPPPATRTGSPWTPALVAPADSPDSGRTALELPADSVLQFTFSVPDDARLVGRSQTAGEASAGAASWAAEIIDADGAVHQAARNGRTLNADLAEYAGTDVLVRIRTWGPRGAAIQWTDFGITDPEGTFDRQQLEPTPLPGATSTQQFATPPDIVVIMLDAARADFFSTYRGSTPTPAVDALAVDGTRFERAFAATSWTGQSVYSLLSGRYPEAHGVTGWRAQAPRDMRTIFQLAYAAGYHTVLWAEHPLYRHARALRYDIDRYVDGRPRDRYHLRDEELPKVDIFEPGRPTFALYHLLPPHDPYLYDGEEGPPPPWGNSMMKDFRTDFSLAAPDLQRFSWTTGSGGPTPDDIRYAAARYQDNLRYADELVRRVVDGLKRTGRYDNAMIILTSDHGEAFYEHGHFLHTWPLYNETLHVPLVIKWPAGSGMFERAIDRPVSTIDIAPTIADTINYDGDDPSHQGRSLLPLAFNGFFPRRSIYASTVGVANGIDDSAPFKPITSLFAYPFKVIHDKISNRVELYDLDADPGETHDLVAQRPVLAQELYQRLMLQEWANLLLIAGAELESIDSELDEETIARLRALGYLQ